MKSKFKRGLVSAALAMMSLCGFTAAADSWERYNEDAYYAQMAIKAWAKAEWQNHTNIISYVGLGLAKLSTVDHNKEIVSFIRNHSEASRLSPALDTTGRRAGLTIQHGEKLYWTTVCVWISRAPLGSIPIPYAKNNTMVLLAPDVVVTLTVDDRPQSLYEDVRFEDLHKEDEGYVPSRMAGDLSKIN